VRVVVQRVQSAHVEWDGEATAPIDPGLLCLVGFRHGDDAQVLEPMAVKLLHLRVCEDSGGRMNHSLLESAGGLVLVPQFTLYADCRKGRRPSFTDALAPEAASELFQRFVSRCRERLPDVQAGRFGAHMRVHLVNDGPVTVILDSAELGLHRT